MANSTTALRRQMDSAGDLKAVVRTMKASAASAIGQYERSVAALAAYARTVELGLGLCLRRIEASGMAAASTGAAPAPASTDAAPAPAHAAPVRAVVFGSDQGLVGRFNDVVVAHALSHLKTLPAQAEIWAVGERVNARLADAAMPPVGTFQVPGSVQMITQLVGQILLAFQIPDGASARPAPGATLLLFHNRPARTGYQPVSQRLLPLDGAWQQALVRQPWPRTSDSAAGFTALPDVLGAESQALRAFIREHLFVSLFRASAESLAGENASRLAAMQRADRNIGELLTELGTRFHRLRQSAIDEELFDVIAGFDALTPQDRPGG